MSLRRKGREIAMQALYQYQIRSGDENDILKFEWIEKKVNPKILEFASDFFSGTIENLSTIDEYIRKNSKNWDLDRLGAVEYSILRMSVFSLLYRDDIPNGAEIDEAVSLAKRFYDYKSFKFINGVLDGIAVLISRNKKNNC